MGNLPNAESAIFAVLVIATMLTTATLWLFFGWKVYKLFTTILTACAAAIVGWFFVAPQIPEKYALAAPIVLGIAGGAIAIPLQRVVAFAATGVLGAGIAAAIGVGYFHVPLDVKSSQFIAISAVGFLMAGIPAALFYRFLMILTTSGYGALLAITATFMMMLVCLSRSIGSPESVISSLVNWVTGAKALLAASMATWAAMTAIGIVYQYRTMKEPKKAAAAK